MGKPASGTQYAKQEVMCAISIMKMADLQIKASQTCL
jgi:hypothetical protein